MKALKFNHLKKRDLKTNLENIKKSTKRDN